jgi:outer membrane lipoprotein carrier protein
MINKIKRVSVLRKKRMCQCVIGLLTILTCSFSVADDADELAKQLSLLETFSGVFEQTLADDKGVILQESSGDFFLQRPGYFRWETKAPFPQLLVSDLQSIWLYDADLEQVTVREYNDKVAATPAILFSGDVSKINQHYVISKQGEDSYRLTPNNQHELFTQLTVTFVNEQLSEMSLQDSLGQTTLFRFLDGVYNQTISPELFDFTPPEGTDIIVGN